MTLGRDRIAGYEAAIHVGSDLREYSTFTSEIDLVADSPNPQGGDGFPARGFMVLAGSGTVEVKTAMGNTRALTGGDLVGKFIPCAITAITDNTAVDRILVIW